MDLYVDSHNNIVIDSVVDSDQIKIGTLIEQVTEAVDKRLNLFKLVINTDTKLSHEALLDVIKLVEGVATEIEQHIDVLEIIASRKRNEKINNILKEIHTEILSQMSLLKLTIRNCSDEEMTKADGINVLRRIIAEVDEYVELLKIMSRKVTHQNESNDEIISLTDDDEESPTNENSLVPDGSTESEIVDENSEIVQETNDDQANNLETVDANNEFSVEISQIIDSETNSRFISSDENEDVIEQTIQIQSTETKSNEVENLCETETQSAIESNDRGLIEENGRSNQECNDQTKGNGNDTPAQFSCDICGDVFSMKDGIRKHMQVHKPKASLSSGKCSNWSVVFNPRRSLVLHLRVDKGEELHKCDVCNKKFAKKSYLKLHLVVHTKEKPFEKSIFTKRRFEDASVESYARKIVYL